MAFQTFRQEYLQMPPVTRAYTTACVLTTIAVQLELVSPFQLYFNPKLIARQYQAPYGRVEQLDLMSSIHCVEGITSVFIISLLKFWRLITTFLFYGTVNFTFFFNLVFTFRYCRMLEEGSFRGRTADFVVMFLFGGISMIFFALFVHLMFLGQAFTIMLVYIWSKRNPYVRLNFFGVLNFQAPYLPWVLLGFSVLLGNTVWVDLMGMAVGHVYYYLEDVFPRQPGGFKVLVTPQFLKNLLDGNPDDPDYVPSMEDRPGGFNWGEREPEEEN